MGETKVSYLIGYTFIDGQSYSEVLQFADFASLKEYVEGVMTKGVFRVTEGHSNIVGLRATCFRPSYIEISELADK